MADFDTNHVRNIALLGHAGSGKTTLAETMLYEAGLLPRRGSVAENNTVSDYHEIEHERGSSIFSSLLHTEWRGYKINILDTPGYDDFAGEVLSALKVSDSAVMLINAQTGVESGTEKWWNYANDLGKPVVFAMNQLDHEKADFETAIEKIRIFFGNKLGLIQYPVQTGSDFHQIIDVLSMTMYDFSSEGGKPVKKPIPVKELGKVEALRIDLMEAIAENDENLLNDYLEKGQLSQEQMLSGLKQAVGSRRIFPLFCLSAKRNIGSGRLMGFIDTIVPGASESMLNSGEKLYTDASGDVCIFIYKTLSEPHLGEMSFFKVCSGTLVPGMELVNENTGVTEKINQLFIVEGKKRIPVNSLNAGDIGATIKLKSAHTNNTLHIKGKGLSIKEIQFPEPSISVSISAVKKGEEEKLAQALHQISIEDPTVQVEHSQELKQTLLHAQGELQLSVVKWKLEHLYKVQAEYGKPKIPYRETILKSVRTDYRHKKQSGGAGQFGEVYMQVEPWFKDMPDPNEFQVRGKEIHELPWGGKLVFYNCIVGGAIDLRFLPSIQKGILEKMHEGPLTGSYVRDVRVSVYDGKMHPVDSNDISFKIAGMMAFRNAFRAADPLLLEPIYHVEVSSPEEFIGDIIGDLQTRRAMIEGIDSDGKLQKVIARVPLAELFKYSSTLRSLSQGRARHHKEFYEYSAIPSEIQRKLMDEYQKENADA